MGNDQLIRTGILPNVQGFEVLDDQQIAIHTAGAGVTGDPVASATAIGVSTVTLTCDSGDDIAWKKGDIITFGDGYQYSVQADLTIANSAAGAVTLDRGLEAALAGTENPADATNFGTSLKNIVGDFTGYGIASRIPDATLLGETIGEHMPFVDPTTGFVMMMSIIPGYMQTTLEVSALCGVRMLDPRKLVRALTTTS